MLSQPVGQHPRFIHEVWLVWYLLQPQHEHLVSGLQLLGIAKHLRLKHDQLHALLVILCDRLTQELGRVVRPAQLVGQVGHAQARKEVVCPILNLLIVSDCVLVMPLDLA